MSVSRPAGQPLTVQIENWPDHPDAPRRWTETTPQVKGATLHTVSHLRPNAVYQLKTNGRVAASLWTDKAGRLTFTCERGYVVPQTFELGLAISRKP
jgi:hypothetical protein